MGIKVRFGALKKALKKLTLAKSDADLQEKVILRLEEQLLRKLPPDYRAFLLSDYEREPFLNSIDVFADEFRTQQLYSFTIRKFLQIKPGAKDDILYNYNKYESKAPLPDLLPIAFDQFRNIMAITLNDGKVYFWDYLLKVNEDLHIRSQDDTVTRNDRLYLVADSFEQFQDRLYKKNRFT